MPEDRTVLDHLLEGRDALQRELERLTDAIEQLDSVLGRLGTMSNRGDGSAAPVATSSYATAEPVAAQPVNPPAEVEANRPVTVRARPRTARKPPAKKSSRSRVTEAPKSIRVHVLEMLQAENREFGLAEIIDRVHDAGIQAHDDAVRSITIKLMKDGRVERVGRGQYRLARRGSASRAGTTAPAVTARAYDPLTDPLPVPVEPAVEDDDATTSEAFVVPDAAETEPAVDTPVETGADTAQEPEQGTEPPPPYTPSLNLGQPWNN